MENTREGRYILRRRRRDSLLLLRDIDRLSDLPDSLLLHILSFLPTKTCVNTMSLVSSRYRNLWEHLQVLNVNEEDDFVNLSDIKLFTYVPLYVNAFLLGLKSCNLRKVRLSCSYYYYDDEHSALFGDIWNRTFFGSYLEELHLSHNSINFPLNLLSSCPKLVSLSLCGHVVLKWQSSWVVCLPLLKRLIIDYVEGSFLDKLLSSCPILEILEVSFRPTSFTTLCVPHSLKRLKFTSRNDIGTCLEIDAPDLNYLSLTKITFEDSTIVNLHKVDEVYLDVVSLPGENLLRVLSKIKRLVLGGSTMKWLFDVEFPEFQHLIHLELTLACFHISFLYQLLQKCPMLQALKIIKYKDVLPPPYGRELVPKTVPNCLVSHLNYIHLIGFQGNRNEVGFIEYVLWKGLVLKTMHISCLSKENNNILRQFFNTPRGSVSCEFKFD